MTHITLKSHFDIKLLHLNVRNGIGFFRNGILTQKKMLISYVES
jgi:hypothetical protein